MSILAWTLAIPLLLIGFAGLAMILWLLWIIFSPADPDRNWKEKENQH